MTQKPYTVTHTSRLRCCHHCFPSSNHHPIGAVPITLQTFAVGLVATILKPREATLAATLYLILGAIGLPVFAGGGGGLQSFFGPSAGYLLAYPFLPLSLRTDAC